MLESQLRISKWIENKCYVEISCSAHMRSRVMLIKYMFECDEKYIKFIEEHNWGSGKRIKTSDLDPHITKAHANLIKIQKTAEGKAFIDFVRKYNNLKEESIADRIWKESEYWHVGFMD